MSISQMVGKWKERWKRMKGEVGGNYRAKKKVDVKPRWGMGRGPLDGGLRCPHSPLGRWLETWNGLNAVGVGRQRDRIIESLLVTNYPSTVSVVQDANNPTPTIRHSCTLTLISLFLTLSPQRNKDKGKGVWKFRI